MVLLVVGAVEDQFGVVGKHGLAELVDLVEQQMTGKDAEANIAITFSQRLPIE